MAVWQADPRVAPLMDFFPKKPTTFFSALKEARKVKILNIVTLRRNISFLDSLKENWLPPNYCWWQNSSRKVVQHIFLSDNRLFQSQKSEQTANFELFLLKHLRHPKQVFNTIVKPNYVKLLPSIKTSKNTKIEKKILKEQKAPKNQ